MSKIRININGKELTGFKGQTILDIAKENDIYIPTLCFDERLEIYGSCGLCVVEVEGVPKLLKSCATDATDGMVIKTDTPKIKESRKTNLELLLTQHTGDCRPPCVTACPGQTDCQGYVGLIANGQYDAALQLIKEQLPLPASIGRVCPHPCETACRRELVEEPVSIANLKSFVADIDLSSDAFMPDLKPSKGKSVAIIGGGPGGLSAAYFLRIEGYDVVIYDAMPKLGGMLRYGIPQYRLPKEVLDQEVAVIEQMGVEFMTNTKIGKDIAFQTIRDNYDAVLVAIGAWTSTDLGCPGEDLEGTYGGINFLEKIASGKTAPIGKNVAIVGGGNTAMDACRTAVRLGAENVYNIYRRTKDEMPAETIEIVEAEEEGVIFKNLTNPIEVIGEDGVVSKIRLQKMALGEPDESGRRRPMPIEGEEEILDVDNVIIAIGQGVNPEGLEGLSLSRKNTILADEHLFTTNLDGVFAIGDAINKGASIAIEAIGNARNATTSICSYLEGTELSYTAPYLVERKDLTKEDFADRAKVYRSHMTHLAPEERNHNFEEIVKGFTEEEALADAARCLECGCHDYFECKLIKYANDYKVEPDRFAGEVVKQEFEDNHPFIKRDPDKCILCGQCVRICDEVMGVYALGLVDRGIDTNVRPCLDKPLLETDCISCGQCISVCPTGALGEKLAIEKATPFREETTTTTCSYCGLGCTMDVTSKGDMLVRSLPNIDGPVNNGLLCIKGRFGFDSVQSEGRLEFPLIRKNGELFECTWDEALVHIAKKSQSINSLYGPDSIAVSISDRYTNEEAFLLNKLSKKALGTTNIFNGNIQSEGIQSVLGLNASPNTFDELLSTEVILLVGTNIMKTNAVLGTKIKKAVKNGAKLITINNAATAADEWAYKAITANQTSTLNALTKALIDNGCAPANADGLDALTASLQSVLVSDEVKEIAGIYGKAKKAMIVFNEAFVSNEAAKAIANIAVVSGHIGAPRNGIVQIRAKNNTQGLIDMGITKGISDISMDQVKCLFTFGEDLSKAMDLSKVDFLVVQDTHMTETANLADVVLPSASYSETCGTFTNSERRIQPIEAAIDSIIDVENYDIICELANAYDIAFDFEGCSEIFAEISKSNPAYKTIHTIWEVNNNPVLYVDGFGFEDQKAKLQIIEKTDLCVKPVSTDNLLNMFMKKATSLGIK